MKSITYFLPVLLFFLCSGQTKKAEECLVNGKEVPIVVIPTTSPVKKLQIQPRPDLISHIKVKDAMNKVQPIALSELTSKPTYIPLETTDESLIGDHPDIRVFNNYILVSSFNQDLKLFDRKTGKFLTNIGHSGEDPQGYARELGLVRYWVDSGQNLIYVLGWKNDWHVFNVKNKYVKHIAIDNKDKYKLYSCSFLMDGNSIYGQDIHHFGINTPLLFRYDTSLASFSEIHGLLPDPSIPQREWKSVQGGMVMYGTYVPFGGAVIEINYYTENRKSIRSSGSPTIWKLNDWVRVKQPFNDTIYTVQGNDLKPSMIFDLGKWHWKFEDRFDIDGCEDKIAIDYTLETPDMLYFHFHTGLYAKESKTYCGIYKKESGEVKIMKEDKWTDPQYNQQIQIRNVTNDGHFCALISPDKFTEELMEGLKLTEDDNPVVVVL